MPQRYAKRGGKFQIQKMKTWLTIFLLIVVSATMFYFGRQSIHVEPPTIDTVIVRDTVRDTVLRHTVEYRTRVDSVPYIVRDTTGADTVYVPVPITTKEYKTDEYFAVVEGYNPLLTHIETYNTTKYVHETKYIKQKPRWGAGVHVGVTLIDGKAQLTYGVGVTYLIKTW